MSDDLRAEITEKAKAICRSRTDSCCNGDGRCEMDAAIAEIARLRAALATARNDAANRLEELHKNHRYNPQTGEGSEHDVGYYRALAEGAANIRLMENQK